MERTLSIIKPDAVSKNIIGEIYTFFEKNNLKIIAAIMMHLSEEEAGGFYSIHKEKPFFKNLVSFMTSGPILVQVLEGDDAVKKNREIIINIKYFPLCTTATNPEDASDNTIRKLYATSIDENAVHGSDSIDNAKIEIDYFFQENEICSRTR